MPINDTLKKINPYTAAIALLSVSLAFMHINFVMYINSMGHYSQYVSIADGQYSEPNMQARLLFPVLVKLVGSILPARLMPIPHIYHPSLSLGIVEFASVFFSLMGLFLLSNELLKSRLMSLFLVIIYSVYVPYIFQLPGRFGEIFITGFFCWLVYTALKKQLAAFILLLILASFQRVDVAVTGLFFKFVYEWIQGQNKIKVLLYNSLLLIIPYVIISSITKTYQLDLAGAYVSMERIIKYVRGNTGFLPVLFLCYMPIFLGTISRFRKFDKRVCYMLFSLGPYLLYVFTFGGFSETRLLHPLFVTLLLGIFSSITVPDVKEFLNKNL